MTTAAERRKPKWWPKSKTVWVNLLGLAVGILMLVGEYVGTLPNVADWIPGAFATAIASVNLVLRFLRSSTQEVVLSNPDKE